MDDTNKLNELAYRTIHDMLDYAIISFDIDKIEEIADEVSDCSIISMANMLTSAQKKYIIKRAVISVFYVECRLLCGELSPLEVPKKIKTGNSKFYILYIERYLQYLATVNANKADSIARKVRKDIFNNPHIPYPEQWDCFFKRIIKGWDSYALHQTKNALPYFV